MEHGCEPTQSFASAEKGNFMLFQRSSGLEGLKEVARTFAEREVEPNVELRDSACRWDSSMFASLASIGLAGASLLPHIYGGQELSILEASALLEGLGEGGCDVGLSLAATVHGFLSALPILKFGSPSQRTTYLPKIASGQWIGAVSLLESLSQQASPGVIAKRDRRTGEWTLQGVKSLVANAPIAHNFVLTASMESEDSQAHSSSISAFLIDRDTPGLRVQQIEEPPAVRTCTWGELLLEDCRVPKEALLGTEGAALSEVIPLMAGLERTLVAASWVGVMRALISQSMTHAKKQSVLPGGTLVQSQSTQGLLADMLASCELSTSLLHRAAWQLDQPDRPSCQEAAAVRLFSARAIEQVIRGSIQIHGVADSEKQKSLMRTYRDVLFLAEIGGGAKVLEAVISDQLFDVQV